MKILKTDYKQREYDGKWMKMGFVPDYDNTYTYIAENQNKVTIVPNIWIVMGVYDYELDVTYD